MFHHQVVSKRAVNETMETNQLGENTGSCCAICQQSALDYYHHWACLKFFAICRNCFTSLRMTQCTTCKGVGTATDITQNRQYSANSRICPSCRDKAAGLKYGQAIA